MNAAHKDHEKHILEGFCRTFADQFHKSCDLIDLQDSPDGLVKIDSELIGIELARYREQGPRNAAQEHDRLLKRFLFEAWMQDASIQECTTTCIYRTTPTGRHQIPSTKNDQAARLLDDLKRLILERSRQNPKPFEFIFFRPKADVPKFRRYDRDASHHHYPEEEWPNLSKFCSQVQLHFHPGLRLASQRSSLDTFFTSLDTKEIGDRLLAKLKKVPLYRSNLKAGQPLWLMLYSEGWNPTGRVHAKHQLKTAHDLIRRIASANTRGFDAIWWADEVEQANGGRIMQMDL